MNKIVTIHSFRRGVGKTSLAANLAVFLALQGQRVALVDRDFQTPSAHLFFGLSEEEIKCTFNDYLWNKCDILSTAQDITSKLGSETTGKLFLIAASTQIAEIMHILRNPVDIDRYNNGFQTLETELALDILIVDTPAGLNEDTLPSIAITNTLVLVLHPDKQDFQGTAVIVDIARNLQVPKILIVLNDTPETIEVISAQSELEQTYRCGPGIVLPHTEELMALTSSQLFVLRYPEHPLTTSIKELADRL
jgi:MinD-like ATPase involved in chromosome partitioning or flagellar assembly